MFNPQNKQYRVKQDLQFGDVVKVFAPFEENTPEYYNGHEPLDIKGTLESDRNGRTGKFRPVMIVSVTEDSIYYSTLTSHSGAKDDDKFQFPLKKNGFLPNSDKYDTFVEVSSVRRIDAKYDKYEYYGQVDTEELLGIKKALNDNSFKRIRYKKDYYNYISPQNEKQYRNELKTRGYREIDNQMVGKTVVSFEDGIVKHHYERTFEEVIILHHPNTQFTRSKDSQSEKLSDKALLLVDQVQERLGDTKLNVKQTKHLPKGIDATLSLDKKGNLNLRTRNDYGLINEMGRLLLVIEKQSSRNLSSFTKWYQEENDMHVTQPNVNVTTAERQMFESFGLTPILTESDLNITEKGLTLNG